MQLIHVVNSSHYFYVNHLPSQHTLSSVNVCLYLAHPVWIRDLNVFYLVLTVPYLYSMYCDHSHPNCLLTSPSHSCWHSSSSFAFLLLGHFFLCCLCMWSQIQCVCDSSGHVLWGRQNFTSLSLVLCILQSFQSLFYDVSQRRIP